MSTRTPQHPTVAGDDQIAAKSGTIITGPWRQGPRPDGLPDSWQPIGDIAARVVSRLWVDEAA